MEASLGACVTVRCIKDLKRQILASPDKRGLSFPRSVGLVSTVTYNLLHAQLAFLQSSICKCLIFAENF